MNTSEQTWFFKPPVIEDTLKSGMIRIERKTFAFILKENIRGRFLRIVEQAGPLHTSLIIPTSGLEDFKKLLCEMLAANGQPPKGQREA